MGQVRSLVEKALVHASILAAEMLQKGEHNVALVGRALKIVRKAAPREGSRDLVVLARAARGAAHASNIKTYKTVAMW